MALGDERCGRVRNLGQAIATHLQQRDVIGRAESVLGAPQHAVAAEVVAFHVEDDVHHMLEHPRAGDVAVLGHVAGEKQRHAGGLGPAQQRLSAVAYLRHAACTGRRIVGSERLDRVDDGQSWALAVEEADHVVDVGLAGEQEARGRCADT